MRAKLLQSCLTLHDGHEVDCSPPGSSVHGILQARTLEWVARPFEPACQCRRHKIHGFDPWVGKIPCRRAGQLTPVFLVALFATPWTVAHQATGPLSMAFLLPFPSPGDLPDPGMELGSPALQADSLPSEPPGKPIPSRFQNVSSLRPIERPWSFRRSK